MIEYLLASFLSLCIGGISAIIGLGGGFLYVPTLTLIFGLDQKTALGTSLAVMIFSSLAATLCYRKQKKILFPVALVLVLPSMLGSVLGSASTPFISSGILTGLFTLVLILISLEMLCSRRKIVRRFTLGPTLRIPILIQGREEEISLPYLHLVIWGAFGGLVSGITGTSGGLYYVPALMAAGVPVHYAVATSLCAIILTSVTGAGTHALIGQISLPFTGAYAIGAAAGAAFGACIAPRIPEHHIRKGLGIILLCIALLMIKERIIGV